MRRLYALGESAQCIASRRDYDRSFCGRRAMQGERWDANGLPPGFGRDRIPRVEQGPADLGWKIGHGLGAQIRL